MPDEEERELAGIFEAKGIDPATAASIAADVMKDPQIALETHAREELGIDMREGLGSPWAAAASSFVTFAIGAAVPLPAVPVHLGRLGRGRSPPCCRA